MSLKKNIHNPFWRNLDITTFSVCVGLAFIGWLLVYRVGGGEEEMAQMNGFLHTAAGKQTMWVLLAIVVFWLAMLFDAKFWQTFAYGIYIVSMVALILVLFVGATIKGATSWFTFGGFSFQPSELAKFGTCLAVSAFLGRYNTDLSTVRSRLIAFLLILVPIGLIAAQPDAGSALVFFSFLIVFYRQGLSAGWFAIGAFAVFNLIMGFIFPTTHVAVMLFLTGLVIFSYHLHKRNRVWITTAATIAGLAALYYQFSTWDPEQAAVGKELLIASGIAFLGMGIFVSSQRRQGRLFRLATLSVLVGVGLAFMAGYTINNVLKPHQQERIKVWLTPDQCDPQGPRYNLDQSKLAISSGGLYGKGLFQGTMTRLNYVPEQTTDFIFCTVGEEQGFVGSFSVIALYLLLLFRLTTIAERQRTTFARSYAYSVAGIFFLHFFINIGMTMGLMPIIGIPLPFISKGGSSLLGFTVMIAVLLRIDSTRKENLGKLVTR